MYKNLAITFAALVLPVAASAQWSAGAGYSRFTPENDSHHLHGLVLSGGYVHEITENFVVMPEVRLALPVEGDEIYLSNGPAEDASRIDIDLDSHVAVAIRAQYNFDFGGYTFGSLSYSKSELELSAQWGELNVRNDWVSGIGLGLGYRFNDRIAAEVAYERFSRIDTLIAQLRFYF